MKYCNRKQGNVADHRCRPLKHPECGKKLQHKSGRKGYCLYAEGYTSCEHTDCRHRQGEKLHKLISGLWDADGHKLGKNPKSPRPKIGRMSDGKRNPAFRTNRMTRKGTIDKRQNWKLYPTWNAYMEAGR